MFSIKEQKTLNTYLQLAPYPEATLMYEELCGFLFGLAMTPEPIPVFEWLSVVYDDAPPDYQAEEAAGLVEAFTAAYEKLATAFADNTLRFPFDLENLREEEIDAVYNWVAGFDEALALRDALWEPEEYPRMVRRKKEGLYNALMTIEGLVDPSEGMNMFADMSDQDFFQAFPDFADSSLDREEQVQWLLLSTLPLAVDTLMDHARDLARKKAKKGSKAPIKLPLPPRRDGDGAACSCSGGSCAEPKGKKKAKLIKVDFGKGGKRVEAATEIFQLKISLVGAKPLIWRRLHIPDNYTLADLHLAIQLAMGWSDYHFHEFLIDRHTYCPPDDDGGEESATARDERRYRLHELRRELLGGFRYVYDYGDDWLHEIKVEKILPVAEGAPCPVLLAGKRACPPEDIGGVPGFLHLLEILADPKLDAADVYGEQFDDYDPARFSKEEMAEINSRLRQMSPSKR